MSKARTYDEAVAQLNVAVFRFIADALRNIPPKGRHPWHLRALRAHDRAWNRAYMIGGEIDKWQRECDGHKRDMSCGTLTSNPPQWRCTCGKTATTEHFDGSTR